MEPKSNAKKLTGYSFLVVFANDDTISQEELRMLEKIALEDRVVDEDEKRVLQKVFSRISKERVADTVWKEITDFRNKHGI